MTIAAWPIEPADVARHGAPLYRAIVAAMADALESGQLAEGQRLPTVRALAERLGVTIGTVNRAYQLAERRGLVRAEVGRGTFVRRPAETRRLLLEPGLPAGLIDLAINAPVATAPAELGEALASLAGDPATAGLLTRYPPPAGIAAHREAIAAWLGERLGPVPASRVVLGTGIHSLLQASLACLCRAGDPVLLEAVTYPGARDIVLGRQLRPVPVALDAQGMVPDALDRAAAATGARVVFLVPTLQNPTAAVMDTERRAAIAAVAARRELVVIEDDVYGRLLDRAPGPCLVELVPERTIHLVSPSKLLAPALRVAAALVPEPLVTRLTGALHDLLICASPLPTEAFVRLWRAGALQRLAETVRAEVGRRDRLARTILGLPEGGPAALHLWLTRLEGWDPAALVRALAQDGVRLPDPAIFAVDPRAAASGVRLGLGGPSSEALADALGRIAARLAAGPQPLARMI